MTSLSDTFLKVGKAEIPILHSLIRELAIYEKMESHFIATIEMLEKSILEEKIVNAFLIVFEDKYVGYIVYFYNYSTFAGKKTIYLEDVFVKEEYRKNGLGTKAFFKLAEECKANDCARLEWSCLSWNQLAKDFYEKKLGASLKKGWIGFMLNKEQIESLLN